MPREYRPGANRSNNSNNSNINSGASSSNNNNSEGKYRNRKPTIGTGYSGNRSRYSYDLGQPSTSNGINPNTSCYRKIFVNKNLPVNNKDESLPSTSKALWKSKNELSSKKPCPLSVKYLLYERILEIQRKFPLWLPEYKTNVFKVSTYTYIFIYIFF